MKIALPQNSNDCWDHILPLPSITGDSVVRDRSCGGENRCAHSSNLAIITAFRNCTAHAVWNNSSASTRFLLSARQSRLAIISGSSTSLPFTCRCCNFQVVALVGLSMSCAWREASRLVGAMPLSVNLFCVVSKPVDTLRPYISSQLVAISPRCGRPCQLRSPSHAALLRFPSLFELQTPNSRELVWSYLRRSIWINDGSTRAPRCANLLRWNPTSPGELPSQMVQRQLAVAGAQVVP